MSAPSVVTRVLRIWWVLVGITAAGCSDAGAPTPTDTKVRITLNLSLSGLAAGERVEVGPWYLRTDQSTIRFPVVAVTAGGASQDVPLQLDITDCLQDTRREPVGSGCPIRIAVVLRSAQGAAIDSQSVGPFDVRPGAVTTAPAITLRQIGTVVLSPRRDTLAVADTASIAVEVRDRQGAAQNRPVLWRSSTPAVATVSAAGLVTGAGAGTTTITALVEADTTKRGTVTIAVRGLLNFSVTPDSIVTAPGDTVTPASDIVGVGVPTGIRWQTRSAAIATVDTVSGRVTAVATGRTVVVARAVADPSRTDSVTIVVRGLLGFAITLDSILVAPGDTVTPATTISGVGVSTSVRWRSRALTIATVDSASGRITAVAPGRAIVVATPVADPVRADSIAIVVPGIVGLVVAPDTVRLAVGATSGLTATLTAAGPVSRTIVWRSSALGVASVSQAGVVTGVAPGLAVITALASADTTKQASASITVSLPTSNLACAAQTVVRDTITVDQTWTTANSPYLVTRQLVFRGAQLTVQPGVVVCADSAVGIEFRGGGRLVARGTAATPIRFSASDPAKPWAGLRFFDPISDSSYITNSTLEYGTLPSCCSAYALSAAHPIVWDSVRFRQWSNAAVVLINGRLSRSVVDTTIGGVGAVQLWDQATFELTTIRRADSVGLIVAASRVLGGRIEDTGLGISNWAGAGLLKDYLPVRITGNRGFPIWILAGDVAKMARDSMTQTFYLGNVKDTIGTFGSVVNDSLRLFGHLPFLTDRLTVSGTSVVRLRPGAVLAITAGTFLSIFDPARVIARGAPGRPVSFVAQDPTRPFAEIAFLGNPAGPAYLAAPSDTSYLTNAIVRNGGSLPGPEAAVWINTRGLPVVIDSTVINQCGNGGVIVQHIPFTGPIVPTAADRQVRILRSRIENCGSALAPAVSLNANSVIKNTTIRGSRGIGLRLGEGTVNTVTITGGLAAGVELTNEFGPRSILRSNIYRNAGLGITNPLLSGFAAPGIWWGDPTGPNGPNGDGVAAGITWAPPAAASIELVTPLPVGPAPAPPALVTRAVRPPAAPPAKPFVGIEPDWSSGSRRSRP